MIVEVTGIIPRHILKAQLALVPMTFSQSYSVLSGTCFSIWTPALFIRISNDETFLKFVNRGNITHVHKDPVDGVRKDRLDVFGDHMQ